MHGGGGATVGLDDQLPADGGDAGREAPQAVTAGTGEAAAVVEHVEGDLAVPHAVGDHRAARGGMLDDVRQQLPRRPDDRP